MAKRKNKIVWGASALVRSQDHRAPSGGMPVAASESVAEAYRSCRVIGSWEPFTLSFWYLTSSLVMILFR